MANKNRSPQRQSASVQRTATSASSMSHYNKSYDVEKRMVAGVASVHKAPDMSDPADFLRYNPHLISTMRFQYISSQDMSHRVVQLLREYSAAESELAKRFEGRVADELRHYATVEHLLPQSGGSALIDILIFMKRWTRDKQRISKTLQAVSRPLGDWVNNSKEKRDVMVSNLERCHKDWSARGDQLQKSYEECETVLRRTIDHNMPIDKSSSPAISLYLRNVYNLDEWLASLSRNNFHHLTVKVEQERHEALKNSFSILSNEFSVLQRVWMKRAAKMEITGGKFATSVDAKTMYRGISPPANSIPPIYQIELIVNCLSRLKQKNLFSSSLEHFSGSVPALMCVQRPFFPRLPLPRVFIALLECIRTKGAETVGFFKKTPSLKAVSQLWKSLEKGDYTIEGIDPHSASFVLRTWLERMDETLIPEKNYAQVLKLGKGVGSSNPSEALNGFVQTLPPLNRLMIKALVSTMRQLTENSQSANSTPLSKICRILAGCFIRRTVESEETERSDVNFLVFLMSSLDTMDYVDNREAFVRMANLSFGRIPKNKALAWVDRSSRSSGGSSPTISSKDDGLKQVDDFGAVLP